MANSAVEMQQKIENATIKGGENDVGAIGEFRCCCILFFFGDTREVEASTAA